MFFCGRSGGFSRRGLNPRKIAALRPAAYGALRTTRKPAEANREVGAFFLNSRRLFDTYRLVRIITAIYGATTTLALRASLLITFCTPACTVSLGTIILVIFDPSSPSKHESQLLPVGPTVILNLITPDKL